MIKSISVVVSYVLGYLYIIGFFVNLSRENVPYDLIFIILFVLWVEFLHYSRKKMFNPKNDFESYYFLICLLIVGTTLSLQTGMIGGDNDTPFMFLYLFTHALAVYWVLVRLNLLTDGKTGRFFLVDMLNGFFSKPFGNWFLRLKTIFLGIKNLPTKKTDNDDKTKRLPTVLVLFGALLILFAVIGLLGLSDENFAKIFDFNITIYNLNINIIFYFIYSIPVGCYFFGLIFGGFLQSRNPNTPTILETGAEKLRTVGGVTLSIILYVFSIVYVIYIGLQISYFVSGFFGQLPYEFTYAEYARRGFFELCIIMGINLFLLLCASKLSVKPLRQHLHLKIASLVFLVFSMFFAATAMSKLVMYTTVYGFTPLRLLSIWAILVLIVATTLSIITILRPIKATRILVLYAVGSFAILCLC